MALKKHKSLRILTQLVLTAADFLFLSAIYYFLILYRYDTAFDSHFNPYALLVMLATTIIAHYITGAYQTDTDMRDFRFLGEFLIAAIVNLLIAQFIIYFLTETPAARAVVGSTMIIFPLIALTYRYAIFKRSRLAMADRQIFVLGVGKQAQGFYNGLIKFGWPQTVRFFDVGGSRVGLRLIEDNPNSPKIEAGFLNELKKHIDNIDTVVVAEESTEIPASLIEWLISNHFLDVTVQTVNKFYSSNWRMVNQSSVDPYWAFEDGFLLNQSASFEHIKRLLDIASALFGLIVTSPLLIIVAILVKITSHGPALFRQTRIGLKQSPFTLYKFRTMHLHEEGDHYTRKDDPRITKIGQFLRKTRIDELPQLFNVLKGEMSLIGPRAEWDELVEKYQKDIPFYHFRHLVKPGITGWAQVNYPYGEGYLDTIEKLKYDLYYVRYYSFRLDLTICVKTIYVILFGKGQ